MICENCEKSEYEAWPKGRTALRCFSPELRGRVMNIYPAETKLRTEAPKLCPLRKEQK